MVGMNKQGNQIIVLITFKLNLLLLITDYR